MPTVCQALSWDMSLTEGRQPFNLHTQKETVTKALKEEAGSGLRVAGRASRGGQGCSLVLGRTWPGVG